LPATFTPRYLSIYVHITVHRDWTDIKSSIGSGNPGNAPLFGHNRRVHDEGIAMADSTVWWLMAGAAVAVELATGTFYLLMIAIGVAAGAIAAHAGLTTAVQIAIAAVVGGAAVTALRLQKRTLGPAPSTHANPDVNQDVGEVVQVDAWQPDGTASVRYRGANWTVVAAPGSAHHKGAHRVREVTGNRLVVEKMVEKT